LNTCLRVGFLIRQSNDVTTHYTRDLRVYGEKTGGFHTLMCLEALETQPVHKRLVLTALQTDVLAVLIIRIRQS
jgi:hypothetical protein